METTSAFGFDELVHPVAPDDFFATYFGQRCLRIERDQSGYYDDVLSVDDLDAYLQNRMLSHPHVKIVKDGEAVGMERWQRNDPHRPMGFADNRRLFELMYEGHTIVLTSLQLGLPKLAAFCNRLEAQQRARVSANAYLTPAHSRGFDLHFDTQDAFILQLSGSKNWGIYEALDDLLVERNGTEQRREPEQLDAFSLHAGDMLYVPRGVYHHVETDTDHSVHLALGLEPFRAIDLASSLIDDARGRAVLRQALPAPSSPPSEIAAFKNRIKLDLHALIDGMDVDALLRALDRKHLAGVAPRLEHRLKDVLGIHTLDLDTCVRRREDLVFRTWTDAQRVHLQVESSHQVYPRFMAPIIDRLLQPEPFAVRELPSPLDDEGKIDLVQQYIRSGVLQIVD